MFTACEITYENINGFMRLKVREDQEGMVADNAVTIAQSHYEPFSWLRGLMAGDEPVGLIAMIDLDPDHPKVSEHSPKNAAYLWRLMIAAEHQGKGFGKQAMSIAFDQARAWGRDQMAIHVVDDEGSAMPFYRRFGFEPTGQVDGDEMLLLGPVPQNP
ncbi:MAG: GNAT family N-acetyltransferase [Pseudomonadota bacterium]